MYVLPDPSTIGLACATVCEGSEYLHEVLPVRRLTAVGTVLVSAITLPFAPNAGATGVALPGIRVAQICRPVLAFTAYRVVVLPLALRT
jgi:hypothetical protein